jgi:ABC-type phosphate transport system substrate-binding protein
LQNYFRTLVFTGKGSPPKSFATTDEIIQYVANTEGAIGYVSLDADLRGVVQLELK